MTVEYSVGKTQVENSRRGGEGGSTKPDWRDSGGVPLSNQLLTIESMLQVSGDGVMLGYLNNPEANAKTFTDDRWGRITIMITNIISITIIIVIIIINSININIIIIIVNQMDEDW